MQNLDWVDRGEYPFRTREMELVAGRIQYVDEGQGDPVVMVHGTPTWSFLYRHLIKGLAPNYRCIAPDQLGFGLSEKPQEADYHPQAHAANLKSVIEALGLRDITLVVHDFGGPIGLSYALEHPENVKQLVITNTWMWSTTGDNPSTERILKVMAGPVGRFLYQRFNFSPAVLLPQLYGDRSRLTRAIHQQYLRPFATPQDRRSTWALAHALVHAQDWFDSLWQQRDRIAHLPTLLLWGMKDITFTEHYLQRWEALFASSTTIRYDSIGHFVPEEAGPALVEPVQQFLAQRATLQPAIPGV